MYPGGRGPDQGVFTPPSVSRHTPVVAIGESNGAVLKTLIAQLVSSFSLEPPATM